MKLPNKVKQGEEVKAEDYNALIDFMSSLVIRSGPGYLARRSPGGTSLEIRNRPRSGGGGKYPGFTGLSARWDANLGKFLVKIEPGTVTNGNPRSGVNTREMEEAWIEGEGAALVKMSAATALPLKANAGDYVFVRTYLTKDGLLNFEDYNEPVQVIASATDEEGTHYYPESPEEDEGVKGVHYRKILELEVIPGETEKVNLIQHYEGDIELSPFVWKADHPAGAGQGAYHEYNAENGTHDFRSHDHIYGHEVTRTGALIEHAFDGENLAQSGGGMKADVYKTRAETEAAMQDKAQFRPLTQGATASRQQIEVEQDGDNIRIQGNDTTVLFQLRDGEPGSYTYRTFLDFEDGLLKGVQDQTTIDTLILKVCKPGASESDPPTEMEFKFWGERTS